MDKNQEKERLINDLRGNEEFEKKLADIIKRIMDEGRAQSDKEAYVQAANELGYRITMADFERSAAELEQLDEDALDAVGGGRDSFCWFVDCCYIVFKHPDDTKPGDACWSVYSSITGDKTEYYS